MPGASMIAYTSAPTAPIDSAAPGRSSRASDGSRLSGTNRTPSPRATSTIGTLSRKTALQSKFSINNPPTTGPSPIPSPETPAQIVIAFARSEGGKTLAMTDSVDGMIRAPPTPIPTRTAMRCVTSVASGASSDEAPKMMRPT